MRLDIVAEGPLESLAARAGLVPKSVVSVVWGFMVARTLVAAVELGVVAALKDGPRTASALATELGCHEESLGVLLVALSGFGLVKRRKGVFSLRPEAARYLTDERGTDLSHAVRLGAVLDDKLKDLAGVIRTGRRPDFHASLDEAEWSSYLRGLYGLARMTAAEVARKIPLPRPREGSELRIVDVAGGHGGFSIALCRRHEGLTSEVLDLEGGCRVGRAIVDEEGLSGRIRYREGDLRTAPWGEDLDGVLLFNILHNLPEADAEGAVRKAFGALRPGGTVAILEGQHAGGEGDLSFQEAFGELLFFVLSSSKTWPEPQMRGWLETAGFTKVRRRRVLTLPGAVLLVASRP